MKPLAALLAAFLWISACPAQDAQAHVDAGTVKYRANDFDGAIADYTKAIEADPKMADALNYRALSRSRKNEWKDCLADINTALALKPEDPKYLATRAMAHLHLGQFDDAKADFATMERLDAKNGEMMRRAMLQGLISRARSKGARGDRAGAIKDLDIAVAMLPDNGMLYHERGAAKTDLKQYKEAIADFDVAIKIDGSYNGFGDTYRMRAEAKRALGDTAGAESDEQEMKKRTSK
jgi:tetratricopeptide (TPR) repeat protein